MSIDAKINELELVLGLFFDKFGFAHYIRAYHFLDNECDLWDVIITFNTGKKIRVNVYDTFNTYNSFILCKMIGDILLSNINTNLDILETHYFHITDDTTFQLITQSSLSTSYTHYIYTNGNYVNKNEFNLVKDGGINPLTTCFSDYFENSIS